MKNFEKLNETARLLVAGDKGLLAMDESTSTCNKRFAALNIPQTSEMRRMYREMLITTPGLNQCISGVILYDETLRQQLDDGRSFIQAVKDAGLLPGIKVDAGLKDFAGHPGEKICEGLDGLGERLAEYGKMGALFSKWRAVITIGEGIPSRALIEANAHILARYAALSQEAGLVPIVEPEVLMDGEHTLERCGEVTEEMIKNLFYQLHIQGVCLEAMLLKCNMVVPGLACPVQNPVDEVANATIRCMLRAVPAAVPGIVFLSGGQTSELASARLNAMNAKYKNQVPWQLSFSYARAIQQPGMSVWAGNPANIEAAQKAIYHRAMCNYSARKGEYNDEMEK
ncbi:class I fructose-bisphosphate aldolase [Parabacteroides sp. FAFU027]|uniref:class I fructose-bisphosphate aldolase n=1 Tax=Parabacteroides sp. FAFU027 TaxID=2922715 RepID=UPI001FAF991E|nr:class I fructose-bisphosphate aldolase [Parabacteroides sp. FAFU027]